jgi:hypothetical protein
LTIVLCKFIGRMSLSNKLAITDVDLKGKRVLIGYTGSSLDFFKHLANYYP